jgi:cytoskeletal protein CcmA (bactofilin family)
MGIFSNNSGKKLVKNQNGGTSLIGKGTTFKGEITTEVDLNINGIFEGNINSSSDVYIGEEGKINGKVNSKSLFINGLIEGEIEAERVEIGTRGKAIANIISEFFIIEDGGLFEGRKELRIKRNLLKDMDSEQ